MHVRYNMQMCSTHVCLSTYPKHLIPCQVTWNEARRTRQQRVLILARLVVRARGAQGRQVACKTAGTRQEYKSVPVNLQPTAVSHDISEILLRCFVPTLFLGISHKETEQESRTRNKCVDANLLVDGDH